jgi:hypothetical protein
LFNDALTGGLSRVAGETVAGGPYAINQGTLATPNYMISFTGNTLTITPATLNVAANPQSKLFGTSDPALTFSVIGLVNNPALGIADTTATVFSGALTRASGETVLGGPYAITQGTLTASSNYTLSSFTGNELTITPALNAPANSLGNVFGTGVSALVFSVTGVVNNRALGIADTDAVNYTSTAANITAQASAISASGMDKMFNGSTTATASLSDNRNTGVLLIQDSYLDKPIAVDQTVVTEKTPIILDCGQFSLLAPVHTRARQRRNPSGLAAVRHPPVHYGQSHPTIKHKTLEQLICVNGKYIKK